MFDQSYNYKNFYKIFKEENYKGNFNKNFYSDAFILESELVAQKRKHIKELRQEGKSVMKLKEELEDLQTNKVKLLENDLICFSEKVNELNFNFDLFTFYDEITDEYVYKLEETPANFYAMKHLIKCIKKTYNLKHTNRDLASQQVQLLIKDNSPKIIIKTDIKKFYESINQQKIIEMIYDNQLLSPKSKKLIKSVLYQYNKLTDQVDKEPEKRVGIPRGIGVSAYLAELYMRDIDKEIRRNNEVFYYVRYVDDIIIMFVPNHKRSEEDYEEIIRNVVTPFKISLNEKKTQIINTAKSSSDSIEIPFLGYIFTLSEKRKYNSTKLSSNKIKKYKERLDLSFEKYHNDKIYNSVSASKMLIHRINYLTKNVKLNRPKKGLIGVYYSNQLLDDNDQSLKILDNYLNDKISSLDDGAEKSIINSLNKLSFVSGFNHRHFFNIQSKTKKFYDDNSFHCNEKLKDNFGKLTSIWK